MTVTHTKKYPTGANPKEVNVVINCDTGAIVHVSSSTPTIVNFLSTYNGEMRFVSHVCCADTSKFRAEVAQLKDLKLI